MFKQNNDKKNYKFLKQIVRKYISDIEKLQTESQDFIKFTTEISDEMKGKYTSTIIDSLKSFSERLENMSGKLEKEFIKTEENYIILGKKDINNILKAYKIHLKIIKDSQRKLEELIKRNPKKTSPDSKKLH